VTGNSIDGDSRRPASDCSCIRRAAGRSCRVTRPPSECVPARTRTVPRPGSTRESPRDSPAQPSIERSSNNGGGGGRTPTSPSAPDSPADSSSTSIDEAAATRPSQNSLTAMGVCPRRSRCAPATACTCTSHIPVNQCRTTRAAGLAPASTSEVTGGTYLRPRACTMADFATRRSILTHQLHRCPTG
jgi:hypothetical protein